MFESETFAKRIQEIKGFDQVFRQFNLLHTHAEMSPNLE